MSCQAHVFWLTSWISERAASEGSDCWQSWAQRPPSALHDPTAQGYERPRGWGGDAAARGSTWHTECSACSNGSAALCASELWPPRGNRACAAPHSNRDRPSSAEGNGSPNAVNRHHKQVASWLLGWAGCQDPMSEGAAPTRPVLSTAAAGEQRTACRTRCSTFALVSLQRSSTGRVFRPEAYRLASCLGLERLRSASR